MVCLNLVRSISTDVVKDREVSTGMTAKWRSRSAEVSFTVLSSYKKMLLSHPLDSNTSSSRIFARHCETCTKSRTLLVLEDTKRGGMTYAARKRFMR